MTMLWIKVDILCIYYPRIVCKVPVLRLVLVQGGFTVVVEVSNAMLGSVQSFYSIYFCPHLSSVFCGGGDRSTSCQPQLSWALRDRGDSGVIVRCQLLRTLGGEQTASDSLTPHSTAQCRDKWSWNINSSECCHTNVQQIGWCQGISRTLSHTEDKTVSLIISIILRNLWRLVASQNANKAELSTLPISDIHKPGQVFSLSEL